MSVLYDYAGNEIEIESTGVADNSVTRNKLSPVLRSSFYVTPEMFGAVGDGIADDTNAVKTAINQGGIIILNGTYRCTTGVPITRSNTIIDGFGTLIGDFTSNGSVLSVSATSSNLIDHVRIRNITIKSNSSGTHNGIYCGHQITSGNVITDIIIEGVKVIDVTGNGIHLHGGPYNSTYLRPFFRVRNCRVINAGQIGICESRITSVIENNYVKNSALENLTVDNGCEDVTVSGNVFIEHRGGVGGIGVDEAERIIISNNHIVCKPSTSYSSSYNAGIGCQCNTGDVSNIIVNGNTIVNGVYGVRLGGTYKAGGIFTNNIFKSVGTARFQINNVNEYINENNFDT